MNPSVSKHFSRRSPSAIRMAQIKFMERKDSVEAINVAIGNVSLPMHPAMQKRLFNLNSEESPFSKGVIKYSSTVGFEETNKAMLNIISSSGANIDNLYSQITDGGSHAMELVIVGVCGEAGKDESPILLIDPAYSNYISMAERTGRKTICISRKVNKSKKIWITKFKRVRRKNFKV